ncbi:hypothetical protein BDF20DRAFT_915387 [Mycotypha africana]|uniref:uncharacterized protein n=1 Tax=Mycotypha africana TaxID=64632 RepID=UPI0022FFE444|nr:uncharacterized protein BDF20DRAFT_915387 [Mycotypha africana]KAI8971596.1 hypothetical protein BDF20DRAFT_915387 [Mycotypha africana]
MTQETLKYGVQKTRLKSAMAEQVANEEEKENARKRPMDGDDDDHNDSGDDKKDSIWEVWKQFLCGINCPYFLLIKLFYFRTFNLPSTEPDLTCSNSIGWAGNPSHSVSCFPHKTNHIEFYFTSGLPPQNWHSSKATLQHQAFSPQTKQESKQKKTKQKQDLTTDSLSISNNQSIKISNSKYQNRKQQDIVGTAKTRPKQTRTDTNKDIFLAPKCIR